MGSKNRTPPNVFLIGARGSGKSYAAKVLSRYRPRVVYIDPTSTVQTFTFTDTDAEAIAERMRLSEIYDCCLWCAHLESDQMEQALDVIVKQAERTDGYVTIIIDEFGVVAPGRKALSRVERSARMGRHHKTSFFYMSQRLIDVHPSIMCVTDRLMIFRLAAPQDFAFLERNLSKEMAADVRSLKEFHYVVYDTGSGKWEIRPPV